LSVPDAERDKKLAITLTGLGPLEQSHPTVAGQPRIEILNSTAASVLPRHGRPRSLRFRQSQSVGVSRAALHSRIEYRQAARPNASYGRKALSLPIAFLY
jgi:hypothetical protein